MDHLGHHVQLTGTMGSDGRIHVDKVTMVSQKGGADGA